MKLSSLVASLAVLASAFSFSASTPGHAGGVAFTVSVSVQVTPSGSGFDWDYTVGITSNEVGIPITIFEIPEVHSGALDSTMFTLPSGWTATEETSPPFDDPLIKPSTTPAAWLVVSTDNFDDGIDANSENNPLSFNFYSTFGGQVPAQFSAAYRFFFNDTPVYDSTVTLDPLTPNVPEPSTWVLMGLGALGLVALRRRKGIPGVARA